MFLDPSDENVRRLIERDIQGPVSMLNMLRFRDVASYSNSPELAPDEPISGSAAYELYIEHTLPYLLATGGTVEFIGDGGHYFVGPDDERWDLVMVVRQNSVADFFSFASNAEYLRGVGHRTAALEDSRLLPLVSRSTPTPGGSG
ncbi:MAG TPA: hypothetical protein VHT30_13400 [Acidimicrobiales bacterium]|jgi:hypothetical protein|nr:hypothetical protein [Acidimicrobiales bacterium]